MCSNKNFVKESEPFKYEVWLLVIGELLQSRLIQGQRMGHLHDSRKPIKGSHKLMCINIMGD